MTSIQPELWVETPGEAVAFYEAAFGATVLHRVGEGDDVVAQLGVGGAAFWFVPGEQRARLAARPDHRPIWPRVGDRRASGSLAAELSGARRSRPN